MTRPSAEVGDIVHEIGSAVRTLCEGCGLLLGDVACRRPWPMWLDEAHRRGPALRRVSSVFLLEFVPELLEEIVDFVAVAEGIDQ
mgnify:CR=1 FL=1